MPAAAEELLIDFSTEDTGDKFLSYTSPPNNSITIIDTNITSAFIKRPHCFKHLFKTETNFRNKLRVFSFLDIKLRKHFCHWSVAVWCNTQRNIYNLVFLQVQITKRPQINIHSKRIDFLYKNIQKFKQVYA